MLPADAAMCLCLSPATRRLVDVGPAADDATAAARFRAFWGERSELRRFQVGQQGCIHGCAGPACTGSNTYVHQVICFMCSISRQRLKMHMTLQPQDRGSHSPWKGRGS